MGLNREFENILFLIAAMTSFDQFSQRRRMSFSEKIIKKF